MNRHAKSLQTKSRRHIVTRLDLNLFDVESFTSGDSHLVRRSYTGHLSCDCEWASHHPYKACSHILAVREWEANTTSITLSFWTDYVDALRQHRSVVKVDGDLLATQRRIPTDPIQAALVAIAALDAAALTGWLEKYDPDTLPQDDLTNLILYVAGSASSEPFNDTRRQALRNIRYFNGPFSLTGAADAAQAVL
jgi:hypothetical protein